MILFISEALPEELENMLCFAAGGNSEKCSVIRLPRFERYDAPVASHPDMLLFYRYGKIFCPESFYSENRELLENGLKSLRNNWGCPEDKGLHFVPIKTPEPDISGKCRYPDDVTLNAAQLVSPRFGDVLFCRRQSTAPEILSLYSDQAVTDVRQGYTHCSVCAVTESAIITSDDGIAECAELCGIDVLKISPGGIELNGYDSGFIGGASARVGDALCFFGDPGLHPDGRKIIKFVSDHISDFDREGSALRRILTFPGILKDYGSALYVH